jgi:actin-like ATPase involved in cell morphogenesis
MVAGASKRVTCMGKVPEKHRSGAPASKNGVIADYEITETLLAYLLQRVSGSMRIFRPRVMITVPYGVTSVERRAVYEAVMEAGSREARPSSNSRWRLRSALTCPSIPHLGT